MVVGETAAWKATKGIDPLKVAIYVRWSTEDQGDGTTLDIQLEGCKHYILSQGWNFNQELVFIDDNCNTKKELYINGITQTHTKKELVAKESVFELRALLVEGVKIDE